MSNTCYEFSQKLCNMQLDICNYTEGEREREKEGHPFMLCYTCVVLCYTWHINAAAQIKRSTHSCCVTLSSYAVALLRERVTPTCVLLHLEVNVTCVVLCSCPIQRKRWTELTCCAQELPIWPVCAELYTATNETCVVLYKVTCIVLHSAVMQSAS